MCMYAVHRVVYLNDLFVCLCVGTYHFFAVILSLITLEKRKRIDDIL